MNGECGYFSRPQKPVAAPILKERPIILPKQVTTPLLGELSTEPWHSIHC